MYSTGEKFRFTLFGKSHGPFVGGILEGVPAGFAIDMERIAAEMALRKPTGGIGTPRKEDDDVEFVQGVRDGVADGNPILLRIANRNTDSSKYQKFYDTPRPGHADLPALLKFPDHDLSGSGQFSGRLTAAIVAAGAIAKQLIEEKGVRVDAFTRSVGEQNDRWVRVPEEARMSVQYPTRSCSRRMDAAFTEVIEAAAADGDSVGGVVECFITGLPIGFGGIWFEALDAELAKAMFGIPACKGVEFGEGFGLTRMRGSRSNDAYRFKDGKIVTPKSSTILPSITRRSLVYVAEKYLGIEVIERPVPFEEVSEFSEVGVCGTAAVISPVGEIDDHGRKIMVPSGMDQFGPVLGKLRETLTGIQNGDIEAPEGWIRKIC